MNKILIAFLVLILSGCSTLTTLYPYAKTTAEIVWTTYQSSPELRALISSWFNYDSQSVSFGANDSNPANFADYDTWCKSLSPEEQKSLDTLVKMIKSRKND